MSPNCNETLIFFRALRALNYDKMQQQIRANSEKKNTLKSCDVCFFVCQGYYRRFLNALELKGGPKTLEICHGTRSALEVWNWSPWKPKVKSVAKAVYHCGKNKCIACTHYPHTDYRVTTSDFLCPGSPVRAEKPGNSPWNLVSPGRFKPGTLELGT